MSTPSTLREYLESQNLLNETDEVIEQAKKEWERIYARKYWSNYKKKQVSIVLSKKESWHLYESAKEQGLKITQYLVHLVRKDMDGLPSKPNLLVDLEVKILETLDALAKKMGRSPEQRSQFIDTYRHIEELLILLGS